MTKNKSRKIRKEWVFLASALALIVVVGVVANASPTIAQVNPNGLSLSLSAGEIKDLACALFGKCPQPELVEAEPTLGALTGPDIMTPYLNVNGVKEWPRKISFTNGTGTVHAIQSPNASSTLELRVDIRTATATATIIEVSTSTNAVSTSSVNRLGSLTLAAGARGTLIATSTNYCNLGTPCTYNVGNGLATTTVTNFAKLSETIIPPETWVVVRVGAEYGGSADITNNTVTTVFTEI